MDLTEISNLKVPTAIPVAQAQPNVADPNQKPQKEPEITFEQFKVDKDQLLLYQVHLERINETLETFQLNYGIDSDNVSLTDEQRQEIENLKTNLLKDFKTASQKMWILNDSLKFKKD